MGLPQDPNPVDGEEIEPAGIDAVADVVIREGDDIVSKLANLSDGDVVHISGTFRPDQTVTVTASDVEIHAFGALIENTLSFDSTFVIESSSTDGWIGGLSIDGRRSVTGDSGGDDSGDAGVRGNFSCHGDGWTIYRVTSGNGGHGGLSVNGESTDWVENVSVVESHSYNNYNEQHTFIHARDCEWVRCRAEPDALRTGFKFYQNCEDCRLIDGYVDGQYYGSADDNDYGVEFGHGTTNTGSVNDCLIDGLVVRNVSQRCILCNPRTEGNTVRNAVLYPESANAVFAESDTTATWENIKIPQLASNGLVIREGHRVDGLTVRGSGGGHALVVSSGTVDSGFVGENIEARNCRLARLDDGTEPILLTGLFGDGEDTVSRGIWNPGGNLDNVVVDSYQLWNYVDYAIGGIGSNSVNGDGITG